jgi:hypothetical protein
VTAHSIARWDGTSWSALGSGVLGFLDALAVFDNGSGARLWAGGSFAQAGQVNANNTATWDGANWSPAGAQANGMNGIVHALLQSNATGNPSLVAGGDFTSAGSTLANHIAQWDGASWHALGSGTNDTVRALAVFDDGSGPALYAAGLFAQAGGNGANAIARWDGANWSPLSTGLGSGPQIAAYALAVFDDGTGPALYVGGTFTSAGGVQANNVARWSGHAWSAVGTGISGTVDSMTIFDDGSGPALYVGGNFSSAGGILAPGVAKWNGSVWSGLGPGISGVVAALAVFDDGAGPALYAGGIFFTIRALTVNSIARWNGSAWSAVGGGITSAGDLLALGVFDDGSGAALYAGGVFTSAGGHSASSIARWNGSIWSPLENGIGINGNASVNALAVFDDGHGGGPDLYAGGQFTVADGIGSMYIAEWLGCAGTATSYCFGDGRAAACPCSNSGHIEHGCENSASTGGALLAATGTTHPDRVVLESTLELPHALSVFLQGDATGVPVSFGDGLRCVSGHLKRLYVKSASNGTASAPAPGDPSITARSAVLGDPIAPGTSRYYQTYYRDPSLTFCPAPMGNTWNVTNGAKIQW